MAAKSFTVGDFALFIYYLWFTTGLPSQWGMFIGDVKQQDVSIARMVELIPDESPQVLMKYAPVYERAQLPALALPEKTPVPLRDSRACGATGDYTWCDRCAKRICRTMYNHRSRRRRARLKPLAWFAKSIGARIATAEIETTSLHWPR